MKLKLLSLGILLVLSSGCATEVYKTRLEVYCPTITKYTLEFNTKLIDELERLPDANGNPAIVDALSDYATLLDKLRACRDRADNLQSDLND